MEPKINILEHVPKDVAQIIIRKLPREDVVNLCSVENKRIRELCRENIDYLVANIVNLPKEMIRLILSKLDPMTLSLMYYTDNKIKKILESKEWKDLYNEYEFMIEGFAAEEPQTFVALMNMFYKGDKDELIQEYFENILEEDDKEGLDVLLSIRDPKLHGMAKAQAEYMMEEEQIDKLDAFKILTSHMDKEDLEELLEWGQTWDESKPFTEIIKRELKRR